MPTQLALELRKKKIKEIFECTELVDKEVEVFKKWFERMHRYPVEQSNRPEIAKALYAYCSWNRATNFLEYVGLKFPVRKIKENEEISRRFNMRKRFFKNIVGNLPEDDKKRLLKKITNPEWWTEKTLGKRKGKIVIWDKETMEKGTSFFVDMETKDDASLKDILTTREGKCVAFTALYCALAEEIGIVAKSFVVEEFESGYPGEEITSESAHVLPAVFCFEDKNRYILFDPLHVEANLKHKGKLMEKESLLALALSNNALRFSEKGELESAIKCIDKAIAIDPEYSLALNNKGDFLRKMGKKDEALVFFGKAIDADPNYLQAWFNTAQIFVDKKDWKKALECFNKALEIDQRDLRSWRNKGTVLLEMGKWKEAIDCFDSALQIRPTDSMSLNNKGTAFAMQGNHEEAIKWYDKRLRLNSFDPTVWKNKGESLAELGKIKEAIKCYKTAAKQFAKKGKKDEVKEIQETILGLLAKK